MTDQNDQVPVDPRAFEAARDDLAGATTSYADGRTFDIKDALDAGKGTIVIDAVAQPALAEALAVHHALQPAKVTKAATERLQKDAEKAHAEALAAAPEPIPVGAESAEAAEAEGQHVTPEED